MVLLFTLVSAGCATPGQSESSSDTDQRIGARVKVELVRDPELAAAAIDVNVLDGQVTLEGFVETESSAGALPRWQHGLRMCAEWPTGSWSSEWPAP